MGNSLGNIALFDGDFADYREIEDFYNTFFAFLCVICAGLAAGLTMGLLSLDQTKLEVKVMTGSKVEKDSAAAILPVIKQHHLLLVTLLLFNALANEALPIFLGELVPDWVSVLLSVTLVLIFGEILPSAFFTGPSQLITAAKMIPFVKGLMVFFWPISYPLSIALDHTFGDESEPEAISREELSALVLLQSMNRKILHKRDDKLHHHDDATRRLHGSDRVTYTGDRKQRPRHDLEAASSISTTVTGDSPPNSNLSLKLTVPRPKSRESFAAVDALDALKAAAPSVFTSISVAPVEGALLQDSSDHQPDGLSPNEITIMTGVLKLSKLRVKDCMIPMRDVYTLSDSIRLTSEELKSILKKGFSRVPVYKREDKMHITGYLLVKSLVLVSPQEQLPIEALPLREPFYVKPSMGLLKMLDLFRRGHCHIALVSREPKIALQHIREGQKPPENAQILGIVTLEDVIEELIQSEIRDETDTDPSIFPHGSLSDDKHAAQYDIVNRKTKLHTFPHHKNRILPGLSIGENTTADIHGQSQGQGSEKSAGGTILTRNTTASKSASATKMPDDEMNMFQLQSAIWRSRFPDQQFKAKSDSLSSQPPCGLDT